MSHQLVTCLITKKVYICVLATAIKAPVAFLVCFLLSFQCTVRFCQKDVIGSANSRDCDENVAFITVNNQKRGIQ